MAEWFTGQIPDYRSLGETPHQSPEKKDDDDDDDEEEKPKTRLDYLKKYLEKVKQPEEVVELADESTEQDSEDVEDSDELDQEQPELSAEEQPLVAAEIIEERSAQIEREPNTPEAQAGATFIDTVGEEIDNGASLEEALESAQAQILELAGVDNEPQEPDNLAAKVAPEAIETPKPEPEEEIPTPPVPLVPPIPPNLPPVFPTGPSGPLGPNANFNYTPTAPNLTPEDSIDRHSHVPYVLVGGLVGYLLGRRRGRIKTEKKLLPIQHKLEKEIQDMREKIFWREAQVRSMVHEQLNKKPETEKDVRERLRGKHERKKETKEKNQNQQNQERLGRLATTAERPTTPEGIRRVILKSVEDMTTAELLSIAENVPIKQSNMRQLFEANRINDEGLRRVLKAYLRGERYDKLLHENLINEGTHERLQENQHETVNNIYEDSAVAVRDSVQTYAPQAQSMHEKLHQAGADTPAPFAQWADRERKKANNTTLIAFVSVTVIVLVLALAFVLA